MNSKRAKVISIKVEIEYSDGDRKIIDVDPNEDEALFWSTRSVEEILAPYYDNNGRKLYSDELTELSTDLGRQITEISSDVVKELWNSPLENNKADSDLPAIIKKKIKCIPTRPCKKCYV